MQKTRMLWMLAVITVVGMTLSACGQAGVGPASADQQGSQQGNQPAAAEGQDAADDANGQDGDVRNDDSYEADDRDEGSDDDARDDDGADEQASYPLLAEP